MCFLRLVFAERSRHRSGPKEALPGRAEAMEAVAAFRGRVGGGFGRGGKMGDLCSLLEWLGIPGVCNICDDIGRESFPL